MKTSKKIIGTLAIPVIVAAILLILCAANGKSMISSRTSFNYFVLYAAIVMITTMALSINLGSGRFDFSLGAMAVLASVLSAKLSYALLSGGAGSAVLMLCLNIVFGALLGLASGALYVTLRIPPIITSLGVTLIYEGHHVYRHRRQVCHERGAKRLHDRFCRQLVLAASHHRCGAGPHRLSL